MLAHARRRLVCAAHILLHVSHPVLLMLAHVQVLPEAPQELVRELSRRYVLLYEKITGEAFAAPNPALDPCARIAANVAAALEQLS